MWSSLFLFLKRGDLQNENLEADRVDACCSMIGVCEKYLYDYFAHSVENKEDYANFIDIGFSDDTKMIRKVHKVC